MPDRETMLLFAPTPTQFREMLRVAQLAKDSERYRPVILGEMPGYLLEQVRPMADERGIELFDYNAPETWPVEDRTPVTMGRLDFRPSMELARSWFPAALAWDSVENYFKIVRHSLALAKAALKRFQPAAIVVPEQTVGHAYMTLVRMVASLKLPVVVVPFTISSEKEAAVAFLRHEQFEPLFSLRPRFNRIVGSLLPQWVYEHEGEKLLRWPPGGPVASWWYATAQPRPWVYNDGHATAIAAENEHMAARYRKSGIDESKIRVTGCVADDIRQAMIDRREDARREFTAEVGLELGNRKLVVAAIPPELEGVPSCVGGFAELAREVAQVGAHHPDVVTLLSLHPTIKRERVAELEQYPSTRISNRTVAELIPIADLYVACASATIRQAIAAGVPVVNFDAFAFAYEDYVGVPGVFTTTGAAEHWKTIGELLTQDAMLEKAKAAIGEESRRWGVRGGVAGKQILALVDTLKASSPGPLAPPAVDRLEMKREGSERLQPAVEVALAMVDALILAVRAIPAVWERVKAVVDRYLGAVTRRVSAAWSSMRLRGVRGFLVHIRDVCALKRAELRGRGTPLARIAAAVLALPAVPFAVYFFLRRVRQSVGQRGVLGFLRHAVGLASGQQSDVDAGAMRR
jgi:hypothetical protein